MRRFKRVQALRVSDVPILFERLRFNRVPRQCYVVFSAIGCSFFSLSSDARIWGGQRPRMGDAFDDLRIIEEAYSPFSPRVSATVSVPA